MESTDTRMWPDILLDGLNKNNVKLFGSTINCKTGIHVQSIVFCMDLETLEYLISKGIFSITKYLTDINDVIRKKEVGIK